MLKSREPSIGKVRKWIGIGMLFLDLSFGLFGQGKVAFQSRRDGNDEIYLMNEEGTNLVNLTQNTAEDRRPWWGPKGKFIFFESNRNGDWDVFRMNVDGSGLEQVIESDLDEKYPGLSSDGKFLVYLGVGNARMGLYVASTQTGATIQITECAAGIYDHYPTWSPNRKWIVFASNRDTQEAPTRDGENGLEVYIMRKDGTRMKRLTANEVEDSLPVFAPSGKQVLFNSNRSGQYHVYRYDLRRGTVKALTVGTHSNWGARYASDGRSIVFVSNRTGDTEIYRMDVNGRNLVQLTVGGKNSSPALFIP